MSRPDPLKEPTRALLTLLCTRLCLQPSLIATIRDGGGEDQLKAVVAFLRDGQAPPGGVQASLGAIERACAAGGVVGLLSMSKGAPRVSGLTDDLRTPDETVAWACPSGQCDRVVYPHEDARARICATTGDPMQAVSSG